MEENINFMIYKENIADLHNLIRNYNICRPTGYMLRTEKL